MDATQQTPAQSSATGQPPATGTPATGTPGTSRARAELALIAITIVWGATFSSTKLLLAELPPLCLLSWRFGSAAIIFLLLFGRRMGGRPSRATIIVGLTLGALLYLGFALQTMGLEQTSSSRSGFLTALYVIFTPLLHTAITRKLPHRRVVIGVALVLLGLWGLTAPGGQLGGLIEPWRGGGFGIGELLTLGCAAAFALYIIVLDRYGTHVQAEPLTAIQLSTTAALAVLHSVITEPWTMPSTAGAWMHLAYLSLLASVLATYWQTRYQRATTPTRAAVIFTMESVFAAIIGVIFLHEQPGPVAIAGGVFIVAGLLTVELKREPATT